MSTDKFLPLSSLGNMGFLNATWEPTIELPYGETVDTGQPILLYLLPSFPASLLIPGIAVPNKMLDLKLLSFRLCFFILFCFFGIFFFFWFCFLGTWNETPFLKKTMHFVVFSWYRLL